MENNKDRFVAFISWLVAGCVLLGMSLGAIVTIAIVSFSENDPYTFAFVVAFIGSLCFAFMPKPKRN